MKPILKPVALSTCFVAMMCAADTPQAPFNLGFVREAAAGLVVAPVRRTAWRQRSSPRRRQMRAPQQLRTRMPQQRAPMPPRRRPGRRRPLHRRVHRR